MAYNFIECNREQIYLMPPTAREWLPEGDLALFIDAVAQMDLTALELTGQELKAVLADAGYCSEANLEKIGLEKGPEHPIATQKDWKQRQALAEAPPARGRIPDDLSLRDRMERKLLTKRGQVLYKKRGQIVEPVFGQIKTVRGILCAGAKGDKAF